MNATPRRRPETVEREELGRLLPAPADPELPPDRHRLLKEHLMQEINQDRAATAAASRRPRRLATLALAPLVAAAAVAGVLVTGGVSPLGGNAPGPSVTVGAENSNGAVELLDRIALAAAEQPAVEVRDDQFVYIASLGSGSVHEDGQVTVPEPRSREVWDSVNSSQEGLLIEEDGTRYPLDTRDTSGIMVCTRSPEGDVCRHPDPEELLGPGLNSPDYRYLESLPTDPEELLALIYQGNEGNGTTPGDKAFSTIGDLLRDTLAPPGLSAALYQAAAQIPGVERIDDVEDAAGRSGVAVARVEDSGNVRVEWIFDEETLEFLGERQIALTDSFGVPAGTVISSNAILTRAVVDEAGEVPAEAS
ncbi:CU044_5270 family protein [Allostreptomyces psammosilenae]|uniref:CU044_5270 family protein n=1 Tax=Allostreptomyces psammosilenae TaxID=1892865 RepID=A0A852ZXL3_9ACTN|nr:CU044_5270 family protein [Allostreptomyces psammosilenae]NYI06929.1 hypothetical protein [Allostreptomyces psammosilenae]